MIKNKSRIVFTVLLLVLSFQLKAQETKTYDDEFYSYHKGVELLEQKQYKAALNEFEKTLQQFPYYKDSRYQQLHTDAQFFAALCAIELEEPQGEQQMKDFLENFQTNTRDNDAKYVLGKLNFKQNNYKDVIAYLEDVEHGELKTDEISNSKFYLAYAYFFTKKLDKALPLFKALSNSQNKYYYPANYYAGYIQINNKNYEEAEKNFEKAMQAAMYENIIPYYLSQTYFAQKKHDALLAYAPVQLEKKNLLYRSELENLIGQAYFMKKNYTQALPYLEGNAKVQKKMYPKDFYQLAFAQYQTKKYDDAILNLKELSTQEDSLGQYAMYLLGDCYLKSNKKIESRSAFLRASSMEWDKEIKDNSMLSAAKLAYESGMHQIAINELSEYTKTFSTSKNIESARETLTNIYFETNNFREAWKMVSSIKNKTPKMQEASQFIAYNRGVELYNDKAINDAEKMFDNSLNYSLNNNLEAGAYFWKGEIDFKNSKWNEAISDYNKFIELEKICNKLPANISFSSANYNVAYCYLKKLDYKMALQFLKKSNLKAGIKNRMGADASLRTADCYFSLHDYEKAIINYDDVIDYNAGGSDYAYYQKGIIYGLTNDDATKIQSLQSLCSKYPKSIYVDDAQFEMGNTYFNAEKFDDAAKNYQTIIDYFQKSVYYKKARLKLALVKINTNQTEEAAIIYKAIVADYPKSTEASEALLALKNLYVDKGDAKTFLDWMKQNPDAQLSASTEDSITYQSAEINYQNQKVDEASRDFELYVTKFPKGYFQIQANYYLADCYYKKQQWGEALEKYEAVVNLNTNKFTEKSLVRAAEISFSKIKNYTKSLVYFERMANENSYKNNIMNGIRGAMRSANLINKNDVCKMYAEKLISLESATDEDLIGSNFYLGKINFYENDFEKAQTQLKISSKPNNERAAESKYLLASIALKKNKLDDAEKLCFEIINQSPSYDNWVGKSLLLLSETYIAQKEYFQARATLETLKESSKDAVLIKQADEKLKAVMSLEQAANRIKTDSTEK